MSTEYLTLKGITGLGKPLISENVISNIKDFYEWALLEAGGYFNVYIGTSGTAGGDKSKLRLVKDPRYSDGQVWEGFHNNWVWQSGVSYSPAPISISGVYVNNTFYPLNTTGTYSHKINYRDGQIIFNNPISTTATVKCEFSYNWINVVGARYDFFRQIFRDDDDITNTQFNTTGSGHFNILNTNRLYVPSIGISTGESFDLEPLQIGGGQWLNQNVTFYVVTDKPETANQISDIIKYQNDRTIRFYDKALTTPPLKYDGTLNTNPLTYPQMVADKPTGFYNKSVMFKNTYGNTFGSINEDITLSTISVNVVIPMEEI